MNPGDKDQYMNKRRAHGTTGATPMSFPGDFHDSRGDEPTVLSIINDDASTSKSEMVIDRRPLMLVTVVVMLAVCVQSLHTLIMNEYLYQHFAKTVFGNVSVDTSSQPCVNADGNSNVSSNTLLLQQVQELASAVSLNLDLTSYGIGMASNMLLGTFSLVMSRKLLLLIPTLGYLLRCVVSLVVIYWNLDIRWFYLAYGIDGICGNICGILLGTFLYTSDVTPRNAKRTLGITIVETVKGAVGAVFYVVTGQLIEDTGYLIPSSVAAGIQLLAVLIICFLPDRKPVLSNKHSQKVKSLKGSIQHMFSPFHAPEDKKVKCMIALGVTSFCLTIATRQGIDKVQGLYIMNMPFCFDAVTIGWFLFARDLIQNLFVTFAIMLIFRCLPGMLLGIAGALCMIAYNCLYAFAQFAWEVLYLVIALGLGQNLIFSIVRGETSQLLGSDYQGPLFASFAVVESIGYAASSPIFLSTYQATLHFLPGFVFLVAAGFMTLVSVLMCVHHGLLLRYQRSMQYQVLEVSPTVQNDD